VEGELKKYTKLTEEQLKTTYANWYSANTGRDELASLSRDNIEGAIKFANALQQKPLCFSYSPVQILAGCLIFCGCGDKPKEWAEAADPQQVALEFFENGEFDEYFDALTDEEQSTALSMIFAVASNLQSAQIFSKSIHELLLDFEHGDDDALFSAIVVDRSVMSMPLAQLRIQLAEIMGDEDFFDKLAKAIKKTRPARPDQRLDDARVILYVLDDVGVLAELTNSELTKCLVDDLQVYDDDGRADTGAAVAKFAQRFKKARTSKP